jgi:hypothetical protein
MPKTENILQQYPTNSVVCDRTMNPSLRASDEQAPPQRWGAVMLAEIFLLQLESRIRVEGPTTSPTRDPRFVPVALPPKKKGT